MFLMNYDFDPHLLLISIHSLSYSSFFHVSFHCIFPQRELHDSYDFNLNLHYAFFSPACIHLFFSLTFSRALPFSSFSFIFQCLTHSYTLSPLGFMCSFICLFCWFLCFSHRFTFVFTFIVFSSLSSVLISMQTTNSRTCHLSVFLLSLLDLYSGNLHSSSLFFKRPLLLEFALSFFPSLFLLKLSHTDAHTFLSR